MSNISGMNSPIPLAVHARLTATVAVAGTIPALAVFVLLHPTEVVESALMWFFLFPFTVAIASGVFTPKVRWLLPDSYPATGKHQQLRSVGFTISLMVVAYAIAIFVFLVATIVGAIFSPSDEMSALMPALFVVLSATVLTPLPSLHARRKHRNQLADFTYEAKDRIIAALLAVFLGGFGGHKFYTGRWRDGVIYLLLFWTIVPWLLGFRAAFEYATMDPDDFAREVAAAYDEPIPDKVGEPIPDQVGGPMPDEAGEPGSDETDDFGSDPDGVGNWTSDETDEFVSDKTSESSDRTWAQAETESVDERADEVTSSPETPSSADAGSSAGPSSSPDDPSSSEGTVNELERLYDLYEEGAITEDEYEQSKGELLDGL